MSSVTTTSDDLVQTAANNNAIIFATVAVTITFVLIFCSICCLCVCKGSSSSSNDTKEKDGKTDQDTKKEKDVQIDLQALNYYIFQSNPKYNSTIELAGQYCSEPEAAKRAAKGNGTLLRTNNGKVCNLCN